MVLTLSRPRPSPGDGLVRKQEEHHDHRRQRNHYRRKYQMLVSQEVVHVPIHAQRKRSPVLLGQKNKRHVEVVPHRHKADEADRGQYGPRHRQYDLPVDSKSLSPSMRVHSMSASGTARKKFHSTPRATLDAVDNMEFEIRLSF